MSSTIINDSLLHHELLETNVYVIAISAAIAIPVILPQ